MSRLADAIRPNKWRWLLAVAMVALFVFLPRWLPKAPLSEAAPSSRSVHAADGRLLRLTLAADGQFRLWTPLADIAPPLREAMVLYEDRWFRWHLGINPVALTRAGVRTFTGGRRQGGSTLTMQLARRLYGIDSRTVGGKAWQAIAALWLEWRYSKDEILEAYLNLAPFGGNVEGAGAASLVYFHKPARRLSAPEAINLAVIPQNPRKRLQETAGESSPAAGPATAPQTGSSMAPRSPPELAAARQRLARRWAAAFPERAHLATPQALQVVFRPRAELPFRAPHLTDHLLRASSQREIVASVDLKAQAVLERVIAGYLKTRADVGLDNASALLVDAFAMTVKALAGSADYRNEAIAGQVNGVLAKRSPGSTLKPFIYGLALDQGLIHSGSVLRDAPSSYGGFSPENFDGRFTGPIAADEALIRSRNVPAVYLANRLAKPNLYDFLKQAGVARLAPEAHYGLALVLGGGEVTAEELAQLYAILANRGRWQPLSYLASPQKPEKEQKPPPALTLMSPAAATIVLDMLRQSPRPDSFAPARPAVAWKTGTSWAFRDAWTAGVFGRHVLVVWVGHFDGASNPALVGIDAAAPLFLRIVDALRAEGLDPGEPAWPQPADLLQVEVCAASGELPNDACRVRRPAWFIAGKSPVARSALHRVAWVDTRTGRRVCAPGPGVREEIVEDWPSDLAVLFRQAGLPLRPPGPACGDGAANPPRIVSPQGGVAHAQRLGAPQPLLLKAEGPPGAALHWFVGDALIGPAKTGESLPWTPPGPGRYVLRAVDGAGLADSREIVVENVE